MMDTFLATVTIGDLLLIAFFIFIALVGGVIVLAIAYELRERWELWRLKRTLQRMPSWANRSVAHPLDTRDQ